jgi:hypothetical protein
VEIEVHLPRIEKLLSEENPFFPGIVSDEWAKTRNYAAQDGCSALTDFLEARKNLLGLLSIHDNFWTHSARHAIFGPTNALELCGFMAGHDRAHVQQIWKILRG